jgi:signal transduction histidine kinase
LNTTGTGLGLSICKRIVEQMGGNVSVESQLGFGTTFAITVGAKIKIQPAYKNYGYKSHELEL